MGYNNFRYARRIDADTLGVYHDDMTRMLTVDKATANVTKIIGPALTGKHLLLQANAVQAQPCIDLFPPYCILKAGAGGVIGFRMADVAFMEMYESGTDDTIEGKTGNNDLALIPSGAGVLKFGTHTATGDAVSNGSLEVKDEGGTVRKIMTKA